MAGVVTPTFSIAALVGQDIACASLTATGLVQAGTTLGISTDVLLARDAAAVLAIRNSTTAQAFRVYNTYTDGSNYERGQFGWSANVFQIGTAAAGTGTARNLELTRGGSTYMDFTTASIRAYNHLLFTPDNTYDIGASGATRPRTGYFGTSVLAPTVTTTNLNATNLFLGGGSGSYISQPTNGSLTLYNNVGSDFSRLQFGGTTSSFPSLKRSSANLHVRLADDSDYTNIVAQSVTGLAAVNANNGTAIPAGGANTCGLKATSTSNFGVFFGSGAPTLSAAKGSLYLRSDGGGVADRAYINTDGGTTWTAIATAG